MTWFLTNEDEIPSRYEPEVRRAVQLARDVGAKTPLTYVGMGMTGVVLLESRHNGRAFKVARTEPAKHTIADEAEWLRFASAEPELRGRVARFVAWHPREGVLVREYVEGFRGRGIAGGRERMSRRDVFDLISAVMNRRGFGPPEYKDDSFVFAPGRGWVLVDAGFAVVRGYRLLLRASRAMKGEDVGESKSDLAWAIRMESGKTIAPHVAERWSDRLQAVEARDPSRARNPSRRAKKPRR